MEFIRDRRYKIADHSPDRLKSLGFSFDRKKSCDGIKCYSIRFPVLKYNNTANMTGEITVNAENGEAIMDVYDLKGRTYAPFYHCKYGNYEGVLKIINKNIIKQIKRLGIRRV